MQVNNYKPPLADDITGPAYHQSQRSPATVQQPQTHSNIDDAAAQLTTAIVRSATIAFGQARRKPKQPWISANTLQLLTSARSLLAIDDPAANAKLKEAKKAARHDKLKWIHQQLASDSTHNNRNMWQVARRQRKGFTERRTRLQQNGKAVPLVTNTRSISRSLRKRAMGP